jgi:KUP system potassium uptake protein
MPIKVFIESAAIAATACPGTAVFMTSTPDGVPHALLHNLKHNKVLHERVILLTVKIADVPYVPDEAAEDRGSRQGLPPHDPVLRLHAGADVPAALKRVSACGAEFKMMDTSFFLARQTLLPSAQAGHDGVARESCSRGCCATRKARWNSSACRPTAWSNWAARSRFDGSSPGAR